MHMRATHPFQISIIACVCRRMEDFMHAHTNTFWMLSKNAYISIASSARALFSCAKRLSSANTLEIRIEMNEATRCTLSVDRY